MPKIPATSDVEVAGSQFEASPSSERKANLENKLKTRTGWGLDQVVRALA
jgi:hypothetical protein